MIKRTLYCTYTEPVDFPIRLIIRTVRFRLTQVKAVTDILKKYP